ncbi:hypothetical protein AB670_00765 [Chryseobacterium sp. MOF25P]|uniref:hypothetical protein n=1 Tax=unclassified Chryseobacterium TaxID=2593645 RepID=UPI0008056150|nr:MULTISPECIES: hypothetical protein [unclassified Chryseobacterium]OBW42815.1 hypothetical protein AB670_00765 [Chryseobacterium sp. MOF25P]OBW46577.1 hypothetical protein AB671_01261 [Chryseobacterium sp. BGARF1]
MKKYALIIIPLLIISCKKETLATDKKTDSIIVSEQSANTSQVDSQNIKINKDTLKAPINSKSEVKDGEITKLIDGEKFPSTLECEFTDKIQKLVIRITNYNKGELKATIIPENNKMNIRFNQIKTPDGKYDGPFGRDISYKISSKGEVWLIIGKNLMAEGENSGHFSVRIE